MTQIYELNSNIFTESNFGQSTFTKGKMNAKFSKNYRDVIYDILFGVKKNFGPPWSLSVSIKL